VIVSARGRTAIGVATLLLAGCAAVFDELSDDKVPAPAAIDAVAAAIACRFGPIELDPALRSARVKFARHSLAPSRLLDDPDLWLRREGSRRLLELSARPGLPYGVGARTTAPAPVVAGAYRGSIKLESLGSSDYQWIVRDELSVGRVRAARLAAAFAALLSGLEGETDRGLRDLARQALPRSSAAFGRLFTLEPIVFSRAAGGGVTVTLAVRIEPAGIRGRFPRFARFIEEYLTPARFHLLVTDVTGAPYGELRVAEGRVEIRLRAHRGALGPLLGGPRPLPDRLRARAAASVKSGIVRVGVESLLGEVRLSRSKEAITLRASFVQEPDWRLPFLVEPLLRAPLRRPFEGEGALLAVGVREVPEGATVLDREYRLVVRESWIVRWLGRFGGGMITAFRVGAEAEADRFMGECLWALRDDLVELASSRKVGHQ
jgi:hypothetical protein